MVMSVIDRFRRLDPEVVNVVHLTPETSENRSILAVELRSDMQTRKPGILIIGGSIYKSIKYRGQNINLPQSVFL